MGLLCSVSRPADNAHDQHSAAASDRQPDLILVGAGLAHFLRAAGVDVVEVNRPNRAMCRRRGKSDTVDAEAAARAVLSGEAGVTPKSGDRPVEAIRVLKLA